MTRKREIGSNKMGGDLRYLLQDVWAYIGKTRQAAMPSQMGELAIEDPDWARIERLIAVAGSAADGWTELPTTGGCRIYARPIPGTYGERGETRYEHELPKRIREYFKRERQNSEVSSGAKTP